MAHYASEIRPSYLGGRPWAPAWRGTVRDVVEKDGMLRRVWSMAWPPLAYFALTVLLTWPLAPLAGVALSARGDPQQQAWILAWNAHALRTDPAAVWDAPIFYPYPD